MPRLVRDRATWLIYAQLGVFGFFLYGFGPAVPLLRDEQRTSATAASLHGTALAVGALLGGVLFPMLVRRFGRGRTLWLALTGLAGSVGVLCLLHAYPATVSATVVASVFGTMVVSGVIAALTDHHGAAGTAAISEANAVGAGMGVLAPLVIGLTVGVGLGWRPGLAVVIVLVALLALVAAVSGVRVPPGSSYSGPTASGAGGGRMPGVYWAAWALLATIGSIEVCLTLWSADVLRGHAGMSPAGASAAVGGVVGGMFVGRLIGSRFALRVPPARLLLVAFAVSTAGFAIFWLGTVAWLAVTGLLIVGLGNAMHYPLVVSMAVTAAPGQPDRAAAYSSYSVGIAFGIAPVALGRVADLAGAHLAFLLVPALLATAALLTIRLGRTLPVGEKPLHAAPVR